jgi:hypothetical protein
MHNFVMSSSIFFLEAVITFVVDDLGANNIQDRAGLSLFEAL